MAKKSKKTAIELQHGADLANNFLSSIDDVALWPPMHNVSVLAQVGGWQTSKFFSKYYVDTTPFSVLVVINKKEGALYLPLLKLQRVAQEVFDDYWKNPLTLVERYTKFQEVRSQIKSLYQKFTPELVSSTPNSELRKMLRALHDLTWDLNALGFCAVIFDENMARNKVLALGDKLPAQKWSEMTLATSLSFDKRQELLILQDLLGGKSHQEVAIAHQYVGASYKSVASVSQTYSNFEYYFSMTAKQLNESILKINNGLEKNIVEFERSLGTFSETEKKLARYVQVVIEFRDLRKDGMALFLSAAARVCEKLFAKTSLAYDDCLYVFIDEICAEMDYDDAFVETIKKRQNSFACLVTYDGKTSFSFDTSGAQKVIDSKFQHERVAELKGQIGSPGVYTGVVRVAKSVTDAKSLQDGEILVTGMTRPEFVPYMKRAGAIITDEGGITCHAAIISRELKIACIIGTQKATMVLKTGDKVCVDANKGTVTIVD